MAANPEKKSGIRFLKIEGKKGQQKGQAVTLFSYGPPWGLGETIIGQGWMLPEI